MARRGRERASLILPVRWPTSASQSTRRHPRQLSARCRGRRGLPGAAGVAGIPRRRADFASAERELSRQETRTFGQRLGPRHRAAGRVRHRAVAAAAVRRAADANCPGQPGLRSAARRRAGRRPARRRQSLPCASCRCWRQRWRAGSAAGARWSRRWARASSPGVRCATREPRLLLMLALSLGVFALAYARHMVGLAEGPGHVPGRCRCPRQRGQRHRCQRGAARPNTLRSTGVQAAMPVERLKGGVSARQRCRRWGARARCRHGELDRALPRR